MFENKRWEMAKYAYENVDLYREMLEKSGLHMSEILKKRAWESIPIIEKNNIAQWTKKVISNEYFCDVALERVIHTHTSGSTGTFLDVYWKKADLDRALMPLWIDRWKQAHIYPNDKVCQFNTTLRGNRKYEISGSKMIISKQCLFDENFYDIYRKMNEFSPKWLIIHPAIAQSLLKKEKELSCPIFNEIKYVELTGEMVFPGLIEEIETTWNCFVKKHYGSMEVQTIGYQDGELYKIYNQSTFVEILDDKGECVKEGEMGNIYVTSLQNYVMPFIRYGIGDMGCLFTKNINGKKVQYLKLEKARKNDLIVLENGEKITADILLKPIEIINGYYQNVIYQFQALQISHNQIRLKIVLDDDFDKQKFIEIYQDTIRNMILRNMKFTYEFSDCIYPNASSGKICWFKCEI